MAQLEIVIEAAIIYADSGAGDDNVPEGYSCFD